MIKAKLIYTVENLQKAFSIHTNKVFPIRGKILLYLGLLLLWTGLVLLLINYTQQVKPAFVFYIFAGIIFIVVHYVTVKNLGKQAYKQLKNRAALEYNFSFSESGLEIEAEHAKQHYNWSAIVKAVIQKDLVMLYVSKQTFYFIQSANITEGSMDSLKDLVRSQVKTVLH